MVQFRYFLISLIVVFLVQRINLVQCQNCENCDLETEICVTKGGSQACHCMPGFRRNPDTGKCEDFDLCLEKNNCSKHAQCINTITAYTCVCKSGYVGDGNKCEDKDECKSAASNECHQYAVCINTQGGYACRCKKGYEQHKDGRVCIKKLDEISTGTFVLVLTIASLPLLTCTILAICISKRRLHRRAPESQAQRSPETPPMDDIIPPSNQQLIVGTDSYYEDTIPMKRMPPTESAWSEWPDYDDNKESDSD